MLNPIIQRAVDAAMARFEATLQDRVPTLINNALNEKFSALEVCLIRSTHETSNINQVFSRKFGSCRRI